MLSGELTIILEWQAGTKAANNSQRKGERQTVQPLPPLFLYAMSSTKRGGTKCRKNKKDSSLNPARPVSSPGNLGEKAASETSTPSTLPSTSAMALPLQGAATSSCPNSGQSHLEATVPKSDSEKMEQEEIQRERCEEAIGSVDTPNQIRTPASEVVPIEVVDLTCESSECVVVDLTRNDSIEENRQRQNQELRNEFLPDSFVLSSDDDGEPKGSNVNVTKKLPRELPKDGISNSENSGSVSCPICMESYSEITNNGRLIMSTKCGHIFCSRCLLDCLKNSRFCPTCRKKLNHKQCHPIYI